MFKNHVYLRSHSWVLVQLNFQHELNVVSENLYKLIVASPERNYYIVLLSGYPNALREVVNRLMQSSDIDKIYQLASITGSISTKKSDIMVWGAAIGSVPLVAAMIEDGVDPHYDGDAAKETAEMYGREDVMAYLNSV